MSLYLPMTSRFLMTRFLAASFAMWRKHNPAPASRVASAGGGTPADTGTAYVPETVASTACALKLVRPAERRFFSFQTSL